MKSQIKDIVIGIFAVIGFTAIVMGFNTPSEPQQVTYGTPESHVWEMYMNSTETRTKVFLINKKTGEVRKYDEGRIDVAVKKDGTLDAISSNKYVTMIEAKPRAEN